MSICCEAIGNGILWDLIAVVFAWALFPAFRRLLPEELAWGGCRLAAPALIAYATIAPALVLGTTPFNRLTILIATVVLASMSWIFLRSNKEKNLSQETFRQALAFEKAHLVFLVLACAYVPFIDSFQPLGEHIRDTALLNAVWTQKVFPVDEPWLAHYRIQYYTFGYYVPSVIGFFSGRDTLFAYNLIIAWTFAAYAGALWLLFRALRLKPGAAFWSACAVALGSNLSSFQSALSHLVTGSAFNWWNVSRVIHNTINEFPIWTATLGDLHPHYLAMPFFVLFLTLTVALPLRPIERGTSPIGKFLAAGALLMAWIWGSNTWELPFCFAIALAAVWSALPSRRLVPLARVYGSLFVMLAVFALPFFSSAPHARMAWGWVHTRSTAVELWQAWGQFFIPILVGLFFRLRGRLQKEWIWASALSIGLSFLVGSGTLFVILLLGLLGLALHGEADSQRRLALLAGLVGFSILLLCELVHLKDIFGDDLERFNTVFKFYIPAWALLGCSAVLFAVEWKVYLPKFWARLAVGCWACLLAGYIAVGLSFRTDHFANEGELDGMQLWRMTAPDDAHLMEWARAEVLAGRLSGVVLEAVSGAYGTTTRLFSTAGLPGYFGWEGYGGMLQTIGSDPEVYRRPAVAKSIYEGKDFHSDCEPLRALLTKESINLVVVGALERKFFPADGIALLERCLPLAHREGTAELLAVRLAGGEGNLSKK